MSIFNSPVVTSVVANASAKKLRDKKRKRDEFDSELREAVHLFPFSAHQAWVECLPRDLRPESHIGVEILPDLGGFIEKELTKRAKQVVRFKTFTPKVFKRRMIELHEICEVAELEQEFGNELTTARRVQDEARELYKKEQAFEAHIEKLRADFHKDTFQPSLIKIHQIIEN